MNKHQYHLHFDYYKVTKAGSTLEANRGCLSSASVDNTTSRGKCLCSGQSDGCR